MSCQEKIFICSPAVYKLDHNCTVEMKRFGVVRQKENVVWSSAM